MKREVPDHVAWYASQWIKRYAGANPDRPKAAVAEVLDVTPTTGGKLVEGERPGLGVSQAVAANIAHMTWDEFQAAAKREYPSRWDHSTTPNLGALLLRQAVEMLGPELHPEAAKRAMANAEFVRPDLGRFELVDMLRVLNRQVLRELGQPDILATPPATEEPGPRQRTPPAGSRKVRKTG